MDFFIDNIQNQYDLEALLVSDKFNIDEMVLINAIRGSKYNYLRKNVFLNSFYSILTRAMKLPEEIERQKRFPNPFTGYIDESTRIILHYTALVRNTPYLDRYFIRYRILTDQIFYDLYDLAVRRIFNSSGINICRQVHYGDGQFGNEMNNTAMRLSDYQYVDSIKNAIIEKTRKLLGWAT